jgi:uncharacterized protein (DUF1697 family)
MSSRHVLLLRGINVGKAKRIAMADLKALVESLGCKDVKTLLNSGNVVCTTSKPAGLAARVQKAVAAKLGVTARVTAVSADELAAIVRENPLLDVATNPSRLLVAVLADPADRPKLAALDRGDWAPEAFALGTRAAYLWMPDGVIDSRVAKALEKAMGDAVTSRNWATVLKLATLAGAAPSASA